MEGTEEYVEAGPNLILVPKDSQGPKADFTEDVFYESAVYNKYLSTFMDRPVTWVAEMQEWTTSTYRVSSSPWLQGRHRTGLCDQSKWTSGRVSY